MKAGLPLAALFSLSFALHSSSSPAPFNDSITQHNLSSDLYFLAGDSFRGRLTDTPENTLAAEYIRHRFERMGLQPVRGSFFQEYNLLTMTLGEGNRLQVINSPGDRMFLLPGQDYYPHSFSSSGQVRGSLVFAGFGITAPDLDYDDYRGSDVGGKIVLVLDHEPGENDPASPFEGVVSAEEGSAWRKALNAQSKGAIAVLFVSDLHNHPQPGNFQEAAGSAWPVEQPRIRRFTLQSWMEKIRIPAAQISPNLASILLSGTGKSLMELSMASESARGTKPIPLAGKEIELTTWVNRHVIPDRNVVGMIEGSDPVGKDEYVIVCAHYDHNGADGSQVFNGADDDGSGTVGLINIAEAYAAAARAGQRPRRSVLFAAWNSEERGLLGAWAYTENPLFPLEKTVATLNMDMIGRNEEVPKDGDRRFRGLEVQTAESNSNAVNVLGGTRAPDLRIAAQQANARIGLELKFRYDNNASNLMRRSDQWPFLKTGVPALFFHTGLHPDYHTVNDRPERVNYAKMERIVRLIHQLSWDIAQQDGRLRLIPRGVPAQGRD